MSPPRLGEGGEGWRAHLGANGVFDGGESHGGKAPGRGNKQAEHQYQIMLCLATADISPLGQLKLEAVSRLVEGMCDDVSGTGAECKKSDHSWHPPLKSTLTEFQLPFNASLQQTRLIQLPRSVSPSLEPGKQYLLLVVIIIRSTS